MDSKTLAGFARVVAVVALVVASFSAASDAAAQGWFAGASAGSVKQYDYSVGDDPSADPDITSTDDTDTGFRAFGGFLFHPNFGVVMSYVDLGTMNYSGPAWGGFTDELSADALDLSFIAGFAPGQQKRFTIFATVGIFYFTQDVHYVEGHDIDAPVAYDYEDSGVSYSYGAGGEISFGAGGQWGFNLEYQRFMNVGDEGNSGHEYDRDLLSAGFHYRFGK